MQGHFWFLHKVLKILENIDKEAIKVCIIDIKNGVCIQLLNPIVTPSRIKSVMQKTASLIPIGHWSDSSVNPITVKQ